MNAARAWPLRPALLLLAAGAVVFAQQQIPAPAPPVPQQTPSPTVAPPEISPTDPDFGEPQGAFYWLPKGTGKFWPGTKAAAPNNQKLYTPDATPRAPGAFVSIPAGKFNHLELSYFQADGDGTDTATVPLSLFGDNIPKGDFLSINYRIRSAQLTWNYLTWPVPPEDSKFRLHTLLGFNYTSDSLTVDAPYDLNPSFQVPHGTRNIYYPTFGLQAEYIPSKHFYFQARAYGFAWPHKAVIGDAEASAVIRIRRLEVFGGYKYFHLKTSPNTDEYAAQTLRGPLGGLRWILR